MKNRFYHVLTAYTKMVNDLMDSLDCNSQRTSGYK